MNARSLAISLGLAAISTTGRARAEADRPVFVTVVGHGAIRLRLAAGVTAPCDSSNNRMLFDGWVEPGQYRWDTDTTVVCFQYTSGALREQDWSLPMLAPTRRSKPTRPLEILLSTD